MKKRFCVIIQILTFATLCLTPPTVLYRVKFEAALSLTDTWSKLFFTPWVVSAKQLGMFDIYEAQNM